ncbi:MAG TPA: PepSY-like domain-containing protein [Candidatus Coprenecus stercoravium]|uniref:PepSY-like domain-containing protein n=1 Tax=Candidatus Coprenecus stercoravium TaxID=2840735 RepID=A0A9D2GRA8_9BACT|nr:PepSY-like domain-containing protein [Candidatus Coprenecus stercoravium]
MRKLKLIVSGCILSLVLFTTSCNKQGPESMVNDDVKKELQAALLERYPDARDVVWSEKSGYFVADFTASAVRSESIRYSAWFDGSCKWHMTETDIPFDMLPQAVRDAFASSEYADWRIDDVDMLLRDGVETVYIIEVEGTDADGLAREVDLYYSEDGVLVKTVVDAGDDYDYNDYIPDTPAQGISEYIKAHYPDARIVDIDREDGLTEVEIIDGRICRELLFDASENWLYTKTEIRTADVPESVMSALNASEYADYRIDDVDFFQTPDGDFYRFELESRDDDIEVDVLADGTVRPVTDEIYPGGGADRPGVSDDIAAVIEQMYPGARILERDYDNGYLEVEIFHDGRDKDVYFNGAGEWVRTEWDVRYPELPEPVRNLLTSDYRDYEVDDIKFVQTPSSEYYLLELEGRGDREINLRVDASGNVL